MFCSTLIEMFDRKAIFIAKLIEAILSEVKLEDMSLEWMGLILNGLNHPYMSPMVGFHASGIVT